jgi:uncharacterized coiled-coil DUF342 family protein
MTRPLAVLAATAVAALGLAACGGDDGEDQAFQDDFPALSERIQSLGQELADTIESAAEASNEELAQDFEGFAQRLGNLRQEVEDLEPPEELVEEKDDLVSAMGEVRTSLEDIASAAEEGDAQAAREATLELVDGSEQLRDARSELNSAVREGE